MIHYISFRQESYTCNRLKSAVAGGNIKSYSQQAYMVCYDILL
jgi:hypothetical protein